MSYEVGTVITFKKNDFESKEKKRTLYSVGTKILFVDWIPNLQTLTVMPA